MKRYIGDIFWVKMDKETGNTHSESMAKIYRAILDDNIFTIDHKNPENIPDSQIKLRSKDGFKFEGSAKLIDQIKHSAVVNLSYYLNRDKALLMGNWKEDQIEYLCIIKLEEVQSFQD